MNPQSVYDCIIVGAGYAGAVSARVLADRGARVLVLDRRDHVAGNAYDCYDKAGVLIHKYGPHIFHTNDKGAFDFLSRFTDWNGYMHRVMGRVGDISMPIPFNLTSLSIAFPGEKGESLRELLVNSYGMDSQVTIHQLRTHENSELRALGEYVYEHIFLHYTAKQWNIDPAKVDPSVTSRVPVRIGYDDRYFTDTYQGLPTEGFTPMFDRMLANEGIEVRVGVDARSLLSFKDGEIFFDGARYDGHVIYSGMPDELFGFKHGRLPYRSLNFDFKTLPQNDFQGFGTVNYTMDEPYTRITEFKHMTMQKKDGVTSILYEYPADFTNEQTQIPYYAIINEQNLAQYALYREEAAQYEKLMLLGRLAEYKYYNMDAITSEAIRRASAI